MLSAVFGRQLAVVKMLVEAGAPIAGADLAGRGPIDVARDIGRDDIGRDDIARYLADRQRLS